MITRYNTRTAASINGSSLPGVSTGQIISRMETVAKQELAGDMAFEWTELTYLQLLEGNAAVFAFIGAILLVFQVLAAQYESWLMPMAVLLVVTMCLLSALGGLWMFQQDIKGLLAYSTISHIGLITLLLSLGSPLGAVAAIFHMLNHATFKASLFMAAGIIDHETGTRDLRRLSGLFRYMPITGTLAMVASAAMAGVPLLNGFLSKEMFFAETIETHADSWLDTIAPYAAVLGSALAVTYSIRLIHSIFLGAPPADLAREPHPGEHGVQH